MVADHRGSVDSLVKRGASKKRRLSRRDLIKVGRMRPSREGTIEGFAFSPSMRPGERNCGRSSLTGRFALQNWHSANELLGTFRVPLRDECRTNRGLQIAEANPDVDRCDGRAEAHPYRAEKNGFGP